MSETKFTPGPWRFVHGDPFDHGEDAEADGFSIEMAEADSNRRQVAHYLRYAEGIFPEDGEYAEAEANARLIATAPDLYAAVEAQNKAIDYLLALCAANIKGFMPTENDQAWPAVVQGHAALTKARGEAK